MDLLVLTWMIYLKSIAKRNLNPVHEKWFKKTLIIEGKKKSVSRRNGPWIAS
jgi:hypothetical protein